VHNSVQQCTSKILIVTEIERKSTRLHKKPIYPELESPSKGRLRLRLRFQSSGKHIQLGPRHEFKLIIALYKFTYLLT